MQKRESNLCWHSQDERLIFSQHINRNSMDVAYYYRRSTIFYLPVLIPPITFVTLWARHYIAVGKENI
jgi:hypothetical protein